MILSPYGSELKRKLPEVIPGSFVLSCIRLLVVLVDAVIDYLPQIGN